MRLDPFSLPVRFAAVDGTADECRRIVDLFRERVVLSRSVRGIRMAMSVPVAAYRGVAIRIAGEGGNCSSTVALVLEHGDPALSLPLFVSTEADDILAAWHAWGRVLGLPLLVAEADGTLREPFARFGAFLRVQAPAPRRRRRGTIARRRPARLLRRRPGVVPQTPVVHRDKRVIIARD